MANEIKLEGLLSEGYGIIPKKLMRMDIHEKIKLFIAYLLSFTGRGDSCFPSYTSIAKDLKWSKTTISKAIKKSIGYGLLRVDKTVDGFRRANKYTVLLYGSTQCDTTRGTICDTTCSTPLSTDGGTTLDTVLITINNKENNRDNTHFKIPLTFYKIYNRKNCTLRAPSPKDNEQALKQLACYEDKDTALRDILEAVSYYFDEDWWFTVDKKTGKPNYSFGNFIAHVDKIIAWAKENVFKPVNEEK